LQGLIGSLCAVLAVVVCLQNGWTEAVIVVPQVVSGLATVWLMSQRARDRIETVREPRVVAASPAPSVEEIVADTYTVLVRPRQFFAQLSPDPDRRRATYFLLTWVLVPQVALTIVAASTHGLQDAGVAVALLFVTVPVALWLLRLSGMLVSLFASVLGGSPTSATSFQVAAYSGAPLLVLVPVVGVLMRIVPPELSASMLKLPIVLASAYSAYLTMIGMTVALHVPRQRAWAYLVFQLFGVLDRLRR
jgi:hypothetical protein